MSIPTRAIPEAERLWNKGCKVLYISRTLGIKHTDLMNYAAANRDRFPARNKCPRITKEQIAEILRLRKQGLGYRRIAKRVGCSHSAVRNHILKAGM